MSPPPAASMFQHTENSFKLGIIGDPLGHTLSPILHEFLLAKTGLHGEYRAYPTPTHALAEQIATLKTLGLRGFNVTIPHKVSILSMLDGVSPTAELMQAVNTVVIEASSGKLYGHNTDCEGFWSSLPSSWQATLPQQPQHHALILGAGGSARAVLVALNQAGMTPITLAARRPEQAHALLDALALPAQAKASITVQALASLETLADFALLVNTTPVGMTTSGITTASGSLTQAMLLPLAQGVLETLPAHARVIDLIYRPLETPLLVTARQAGYATLNGLGMLVQQGVLAFTHWTGQPISAELAQAAQEYLQDHLQKHLLK